jgi:hypothetical protein
MTIYSLDNITLREAKALRKALDFIPITGIDAAFIAVLQNKISTQVVEIENHIKSEENQKQSSLEEIVENTPKSSTSKRGKNS